MILLIAALVLYVLKKLKESPVLQKPISVSDEGLRGTSRCVF